MRRLLEKNKPHTFLRLMDFLACLSKVWKYKKHVLEKNFIGIEKLFTTYCRSRFRSILYGDFPSNWLGRRQCISGNRAAICFNVIDIY